MNTPPPKAGNPEADVPAATKPGIGGSERQNFVGAERPRPILKAVVTAVFIIAIGVAIYFLAIYPRVQNSKELAAAAVAAGKTTVTVVDPTRTCNVQTGTPATVTVDELPGRTFAGKVTRDAGAFDQSSRTLLLEIDVPNPAGRLYAGMYAHAKFALKNPTPALLYLFQIFKGQEQR
jgi:multidrug efflux pump subunit AcrA (membrane-fusion protein)